MDLAVNRFDISHGVVRFADREIQFSADGRNLTAQLLYDSKTPEYKGAISINPLYLSNADRKPVEAQVRLPVSIGRDSVQLSNASISTPESKIDLSARLAHLESPIIDAKLNAKLSLGGSAAGFGGIHLSRAERRSIVPGREPQRSHGRPDDSRFFREHRLRRHQVSGLGPIEGPVASSLPSLSSATSL